MANHEANVTMTCMFLYILQKELKDGQNNSVLLYLKKVSDANIEEAIDCVQSMLDKAKMKMLEHALREDMDDVPKCFNKLQLKCLKAFQMFFNSAIHFDLKESSLSDINKAIFIPLEFGEENRNLQPSKPRLPLRSSSKKKVLAPVLAPINNYFCILI